MMTRLRFLTAGESHGPKLTAIIEGVPAGFPIDPDRIDEDLARRQRGPGSGGRMEIEHDRATITSGMMAGRTTGAPIAIEIPNLDHDSWKDRDIDPMVTPRPGHADLTGAIKYGHHDLRPSLERASARETASRVAIGGICKQILSEFGIQVGSRVLSIGSAGDDESMKQAIESAAEQGDTLGGLIEISASRVPPGLGSYAHWDRRLDARLAMAMMSIQAMKGVEIGPAFENASRPGSAVHDEISTDGEKNLVRKTNRAGGIEGGISNGQPIVVRVAMKPISTTSVPRPSVNLATGEPAHAAHERSDVCAVHRAAPVAEAMLALVLADALLEKLGGDSLEEMRPRFEDLRLGRLGDFNLDNEPWRP